MRRRDQGELDTDELSALAQAEAQIVADELKICSEEGGRDAQYILRRRIVEYVPLLLLLVLSSIVVLLGSWWGALMGGGASIILVIVDTRRIGRFTVDSSGLISIEGRSIDWSDLAEIEYHYVCPWYASVLLREVWITASVSMRFGTDGRILKLARGALWQLQPKRMPLTLDQLANMIKRQARSAGLQIIPGEEDAWVARRP